VADFGLSQRKVCAGTPYFMAPELLRGAPNTVASDVYAFGVVLFEMTTKLDPYEGEDFDEVIDGVVRDKKRPELPRGVPPELATVMRECWHWDPRRRPTFLELERRMAHFDSLHVAERNMKRNRGNNVVLDQVFPAHVAKALASGQKLQPEHYEKVTIFFSDIVGFTDISETVPPAKVCDMLDRLYTRLDILTEKYDIFKVETIGKWSTGLVLADARTVSNS
jgi:serine/threonine protein kinase